MKHNKILSVLLAAASVTAASGALAGCSLGNRAPAVIDKEAVMSIEDPENYVYPEEITLRIPVYDRGQSGLPPVTDNYWTKLVQEEFGKKHNINVEFVSIPRSGEVTKFNQLMAGKVKNQPDILFHYDYPQIITYAKEGAFQNIDEDMLKKFAPDYYEHTKDLDEYTYVNGEKVFMCGTRPRAYNYISVIRADWVKKCGYTIPEDQSQWVMTEDEYIEMLKKFKEMQCGGPNTIPLGMQLPNANYSNHAYRDYPLSARDWALYSDLSVCSLTWEPTKETLKHQNMYKHEGLYSEEWYLDEKGNTSKANFTSGIQGVYGFYLTKESAEISALMQNCPEAELAIVPTTTTDGIVKGGRADNPFGLVSGINVHCQHPEAVMMYFEWLQDNIFLMQNGIEGQNFTYTTLDDGSKIPVIDDKYDGESKFNYNSNKDMWCLVTEGRDYGSPELNLKAQIFSYAPSGYEYLLETNYKKIVENDHLNYIDFLFDRSIDSLSDKSATLLNTWQKIATDLINCDPDEFDAKYEQYCQEYLDAGYQEILDEKLAAYEDMKANGDLPDPLPEGIKTDED